MLGGDSAMEKRYKVICRYKSKTSTHTLEYETQSICLSKKDAEKHAADLRKRCGKDLVSANVYPYDSE